MYFILIILHCACSESDLFSFILLVLLKASRLYDPLPVCPVCSNIMGYPIPMHWSICSICAYVLHKSFLKITERSYCETVIQWSCATIGSWRAREQWNEITISIQQTRIAVMLPDRDVAAGKVRYMTLRVNLTALWVCSDAMQGWWMANPCPTRAQREHIIRILDPLVSFVAGLNDSFARTSLRMFAPRRTCNVCC